MGLIDLEAQYTINDVNVVRHVGTVIQANFRIGGLPRGYPPTFAEAVAEGVGHRLRFCSDEQEQQRDKYDQGSHQNILMMWLKQAASLPLLIEICATTAVGTWRTDAQANWDQRDTIPRTTCFLLTVFTFPSALAEYEHV
jgi:hypothetical protein